MQKRVTVVHRTQHRIALVESGEERLECSLLVMGRIGHLNSVYIQPSVVVELVAVVALETVLADLIRRPILEGWIWMVKNTWKSHPQEEMEVVEER
jgi:hypothetical protein